MRRMCNTLSSMKTLTVRLPEALVAQLESESRRRDLSKSEIVRERLMQRSENRHPASLVAIADLIGSVGGLPHDLSAQTKAYFKSKGYGRKRAKRAKNSSL